MAKSTRRTRRAASPASRQHRPPPRIAALAAERGSQPARCGRGSARATRSTTSGKQWGPYAVRPAPAPRLRNRNGRAPVRSLFRYDPLKTIDPSWRRTAARSGPKRHRDPAERRHVERQQEIDRRGYEVHPSRRRRTKGAQYGTMWRTGLQRVSTEGGPSRFHLPGTPNYQEWDYKKVYRRRSCPGTSGGATAPKRSPGQHRRHVEAGRYPAVQLRRRRAAATLQWNRHGGWWRTRALGIRMPMKHIVDIHNTSNTASLQNFLQNKIDLSNNFFPGINR